MAGSSPQADHFVRVLPDGPAPGPKRPQTRRSLLYFGHLTDLHVTDEMSPLRTEFADPAEVGDWAYNAAWRPQEALSAQTADRAIRSMNRRISSSQKDGAGRRARMAFALVTGDLVDNLQRNEMRMAVGLLEGKRVDPFSGAPIDAANPCVGATPAERERLDASVAARRYSGVQRYSQYPASAPAERMLEFYDPSREAPSVPGPPFPRYSLPLDPGLLDRAQVPFAAAGLRVPFFVARGNHGTLVQGFYPPWLLESLYHLERDRLGSTGCRKLFPNAETDPSSGAFAPGPVTPERQAKIVATMQALYREAAADDTQVASLVPPDPERALLVSPEYPTWFTNVPMEAGYAFVDAEERRASDGYAHYYAFTPKPGLRFISLDTNAANSGPDGNLDDPQFRWLERELAELPPDTLAVVFGHHSLETLRNRSSDSCGEEQPGCHGDPRASDPVHLGCPQVGGGADCGAPFDPQRPPDNLRDLLLRTPAVILFVNGHTHVNGIAGFSDGDGGGFWQVTTASVVDWPQQTRTLELMDNRDGTLSIFGTLVDLEADARPPAADKPAERYSDEELRSVARTLAAGDVQWRDLAGAHAEGRVVDGVNIDGNVELVLRDPRVAAD